MPTLYLDIDTQQDFVFPSGALYVPGAEHILARVAALNREAMEGGHTLVATMDEHSEDDPEFAIWPHHCVAGTLGQRKPEITLVSGIRFLTKQSLDCFSNPQLDTLLREGRFTHALLYGVVTEICVMHAAFGLLDRGIGVEIQSNAVKELNAQAQSDFFNQVRARGGKIA